MEPLSTTASITAILQLSSEAVKYIKGVAGATTERKRLRDEIRSCEYILQRLKDEVEDVDGGQVWSEKIIALEDGPLGRLKSALVAIMPKLEPKKGWKKTSSALKWPFKKIEVEGIISMIEREKTLLIIALNHDCQKLIYEIHKSLKETSRLPAQLEDGIRRIEESHAVLKGSIDQLHGRQGNHEYEQRREAIVNWLTPIDYTLQQSNFFNRRQEGTGQWFLDSTEFQNWIETGNTLFCPGIPGAGKTILTSVVVKELNTRFENNKSIGVAYLYCDFRRQDEQKAEDLLASLLKQLTQSHSSIPATVESFYNEYKNKRTQLSLDKISEALQSVAALYSRVFIIIDALDECQESNGCRMKFLSEIFKLQAKCQTSLFATSRSILDINERFEGSMRLKIQASNQDIQTYLNGNKSQLPRCALQNLELQEEIKTEIIKAVDGMFLLAQLHLESLKGKKTITAIRHALKKLPTGSGAYNKLYKEAMERIEGRGEDDEELAKKVLAWITFAKRPLTTSELKHALAVKEGDLELDEENCCVVEDIVSVCEGLVTVDKESSIIRLVHYTTQEYFKQAQEEWFPHIEKEITTTCITYLSFEDFNSGFCQNDTEFEKRLQLNQFYDYASHNWGHHAHQASTLDAAIIVSFLEKKEHAVASSQGLLADKLFLHDSNYSQGFPKEMTGLHLAAYFGLRRVVQLLLCTNSLDPKDSFGRTPLSWAAENGHEAVVKLLLAKDELDLNSEDEDGCTPLFHAAKNGHEAVVKLLLAKDGIDPDAKNKFESRTPLFEAATKGHEAVVKLLLAKDGVDPDPKDWDGSTPIQWAAINGNEAVVKLFLANDNVDPDRKDRQGLTPISWAAMGYHEAVVRLFLAKDGVNPNPPRVSRYLRLIQDYGSTFGQEKKN